MGHPSPHGGNARPYLQCLQSAWPLPWLHPKAPAEQLPQGLWQAVRDGWGLLLQAHLHHNLVGAQVGKWWPACEHVPHNATPCPDVHLRREWRGFTINSVLLWRPAGQQTSRVVKWYCS
jgi:hypothetical protein